MHFVFTIYAITKINYMRAWALFIFNTASLEVSDTVELPENDGFKFWNGSLNNMQHFGIQRANIPLQIEAK